MAQRIQLKRTKGWRKPEGAVVVARPSMWGNYAGIRDGMKRDRADQVALFRLWVETEASWAWKGRAKIDLRGKDLACWCPLDQPCHADVLLELANS